jgi:TolB protein
VTDFTKGLQAALLGIFLAACQPVGTTTPPDLPDGTREPIALNPPAPTGEIAFTTDRGGNPEIYLMAADGTRPRNLTRHPAADYSPVWSPDGERIAFVSDRSGLPEVYIMNADGSAPQALTPDREAYWGPPFAWSPSGTQLLAARLPVFTDHSEIKIVDGQGGGFQPLYPAYREFYSDTAAEWLPSGEVVFRSWRYSAGGLYSVVAGGTPRNVFVRAAEPVQAFSVSPDGEMLAMVTWDQDYRVRQFEYDTRLALLNMRSGVELAAPDGSFLDVYGQFELSWSPDGNRVAFPARRVREHSELWVWFVTFPGDLDRNLVPLTELGGVRGRPSWSPDGRWVAFVSDVDGDWEIYLLQVGRTPATALDPAWRLLQLTENDASDGEAVWRP